MNRHRFGCVAAALTSVLVAGCDTQQQVTSDGIVTQRDASGALTGPSCTPTGAHAAHSSHACTTCHSVPGSLCFDPAGPAQAPGKPAPDFDFTAKTCSNVACHGTYAGVYEYTVWDWGCECSIPQSVPYGGSGGGTPSWYSTGLGCAACHGSPPTMPDSPSYYSWHSNIHGRPFSPAAIQCATCHRDGIGDNATGGTGINPTFAALHGNGVLDVTPQWTGTCFSCH